MDTGSTFSLIEKSLWNKLSGYEDYQPSGGQTFLLANGQRQSSLGKVNWDCDVQGQKMNVTFYVMQDSDLTVPNILGINFLLKSKTVLDLKKHSFSYLPHQNQRFLLLCTTMGTRPLTFISLCPLLV